MIRLRKLAIVIGVLEMRSDENGIRPWTVPDS
jgi:hypothetical protein